MAYASQNDDFLKTLNEVSEIATQTKLNIDKTPSNVDVIRRDFILKSGAKTLLDILQYIPGVEISMSSSGKKELVIRGNKTTYRDKIKFMINGIDVTNNLYTNQFYYYNFPASLIKRIEFTKTPDSVLYGGTAFLGVINVITLDEYSDNFFNFYISNKNEYSGSYFNKFDNFLFDLYYSYSKPDLISPSTYLINLSNPSQTYIYRRQVSANTSEKTLGIGVKYKLNENTSLSYRLQYYQKGDFFGLLRLTPLDDDKKINLTHQYFNLKNIFYLKYNLKNEINTGIKLYQWKGEYRTFPYDFNVMVDDDPSNDLIVGANVKEKEYYFRDVVTYENDKHNLTALFEAKYAKPYDYYYLQYVESLGDNQNLLNLGPNGEHLTGENNVLKEGVYRKTLSFAIQDLYIFNDKFAVTIGGRLDNYSDFGNKPSYKIGGVYNYSPYTTFKLLFNNAYRVPNFIELYIQNASDIQGNENLKPETIDMLEAIIIKKFNNNDKLKFTYFYGINTDCISTEYDMITGKKIYKNLGKYYIRGFEISYDTKREQKRFYVSYSYNNNYYTFDDIVGNINLNDWPGNRKHLLKSYYVYNFNNNKSVSFSMFYGSKIEVPHYTDGVNSYFALNSNYKFKYKNFSINLGIDNITDHKNYYWTDPGNIVNLYMFEFTEAKIPAVGRKIYFNIEKSW
jgi:iron complex outermembrane receptor protein